MCIVVQITLSNSSFSQSSIPRSAGSFLGNTKMLEGNFISLCLIVTLHMPNCGMLELLYVHSLILLLIYLYNSEMAILGNIVLNTLMAIMLLSLPASIL